MLIESRPFLAVLIAVGLLTVDAFAQRGRPAGLSQPDIVAALRTVERENIAAAALRALDRYLETWNSRDPEVWATSLHFPHVRPSARQFSRAENAVEYAAGVSFPTTLATGWHRSQWESMDVLHVGDEMVHVAGTYTRYRENGDVIWTNQVTYIVTKQNGRWGTQSRFGAGPIVRSGETLAANSDAAHRAVRAYFDALNSLDANAWAETLHFPHVRLAGGELQMWYTPDEYLAGTQPGRQRTWYHTELTSLDVVQVGVDAANVRVRYSRLNSKGDVLSVYDAVYLVTNRNERWAIQARASYGPR